MLSFGCYVNEYAGKIAKCILFLDIVVEACSGCSFKQSWNVYM